MSGLASVFPPPPPYYKRYTAEAWEAYKEAPAAESELAPPPLPSQPTYRNFGAIWNVSERLPSLADSGIEQLYTSGCEHSASTLVPELKRLLYDGLRTFLELLQRLAESPEEFPEKVERLRTLFINMHHLLNTYRPVQSKESLIRKTMDQIAAAQLSTQRMRESNEQISRQLSALEQRLPLVQAGRRVILDSSELGNSLWDGFDLDADFRPAETEGAIE